MKHFDRLRSERDLLTEAITLQLLWFGLVILSKQICLHLELLQAEAVLPPGNVVQMQ